MSTRDTATDPRVAEHLVNPGAYVQQTGYTEQGLLLVGFDTNALRTWLLARGLSVWGDDRPAVMLWLAVDLEGGNRSIVGADDESGVQSALVSVAAERGLPLQLPLLDAQDLARVPGAAIVVPAFVVLEDEALGRGITAPRGHLARSRMAVGP